MLGAEIWKKTSPLPEDAVFWGMLSLKQTFVDGQILATWAAARDAVIGQYTCGEVVSLGRTTGCHIPRAARPAARILVLPFFIS